MNFIRVKNSGHAVKTVLVEGQQHYIAPGKVATLRPELADVFMKTHPECQKVVIGGVQRDAQVMENATTWVANMTGDPDCDKTIDTKYFDNQIKRWQKRKIPHPLLNEAVLSFLMRGGMEEYLDHSGQVMARNLASSTYAVDPYQRVEVPTHVGDWMLMRDARSDMRKGLIKSRAPGELDGLIYDWDLEKIEALVKFIDPMCRKVANTEEKVLSVYKGKKALSKIELEHKLFDERETWIKRAHFRLANPDYKLPTRFEFEEYYAGQKETA